MIKKIKMNTTLILSRNSGFFSDCTVCLRNIISHFNKQKNTPFDVDFSSVFQQYKPTNSSADISKMFFSEKEHDIEYTSDVKLTSSEDEDQFSDYKLLNFKEINPFIEKYFSASTEVDSIILKMEEKYSIDYKNTIAVFYRGNDKCTETNIGSYDIFLDKILSVSSDNSDKKIIIQTDDQTFLDYCKEKIDNNKIIVFDEVPRMNSDPHVVMHKLIEPNARALFATYFLAIVKMLSKSDTLITHSGNCGMWAVLFRGNSNNVHQYLNSIYKSQSDGWL